MIDSHEQNAEGSGEARLTPRDVAGFSDAVWGNGIVDGNEWVQIVWERIQSLIQRFQNGDRIVLGTPMWNFGVPYKLK